MPSVAHSTHRTQPPPAPTYQNKRNRILPTTAGQLIKDRIGRLAVFLVGPFLVCAYFVVVTMLKFTDRGHQ